MSYPSQFTGSQVDSAISIVRSWLVGTDVTNLSIIQNTTFTQPLKLAETQTIDNTNNLLKFLDNTGNAKVALFLGDEPYLGFYHYDGGRNQWHMGCKIIPSMSNASDYEITLPYSSGTVALEHQHSDAYSFEYNSDDNCWETNIPIEQDYKYSQSAHVQNFASAALVAKLSIRLNGGPSYEREYHIACFKNSIDYGSGFTLFSGSFSATGGGAINLDIDRPYNSSTGIYENWLYCKITYAGHYSLITATITLSSLL